MSAINAFFVGMLVGINLITVAYYFGGAFKL